MYQANATISNPRSSNLELYRIICMLMIVAHHFVVNSGLGEVLSNNPLAIKSIFLYWFGMWGKTGINCFLLITGYFMCKSQITFRKFLKLLLEIYLYRIVIYLILLAAGYEVLTYKRIFVLLMPVWGFTTNFVSCFLGFYLTIPFLNILVSNMTQRQHQLLLLLMFGMYSVLGNILPSFHIGMNYVTWFGIIYLLASYVRLYPSPIIANRRLWAIITFLAITTSMASVVLMLYWGKSWSFFVSDSNKFLAVLVALSSFLWLKNTHIPQSKVINAIGGSTFGVLLIHAASDAMRTWLWRDTVDCVGHYDLPLGKLILFSIGVVLAIFIICIIIDRIRITLLERPFFSWYDKRFPVKS